jgi:hypothetical protein
VKTKQKLLATKNQTETKPGKEKLSEITHTAPPIIPPNVASLERIEQRNKAPEFKKLLNKFAFLVTMGTDASLNMGLGHLSMIYNSFLKDLFDLLG